LTEPGLQPDPRNILEDPLRKRWVARPAPAIEMQESPDDFGLPPSVALLLARRGYTGASLLWFLNPGLEHLSRPDSIPGMRAAVNRIASAVRNGQRIMVHGDYDADGLTATATAFRALCHLGAGTDFFIPDRFEDGYGLGDSSVDACARAGADLIVTVDCGVSDAEHVRILRRNGVDVVITDHHQPGEEMPPAVAIVDPALEPGSPAGVLAGVGVAWMTMRGVYEELDAGTEYLDGLLQLVALGTVADVVDLTGDNRILVSRGLGLLRESPFPGLEALARSASVETGGLTSGDLAYYLGPRLNACGRMGRADDAMALLLSEDLREARVLAATVEGHNRNRRKLDREVEGQVMGRAAELESPRCILMAGEGWHRGVIGIVASRIADRFGVPSLMISLEDGRGYGSARSVPGIPIHSILMDIQARSGIMESIGGHPMAAGFRLPAERVGELEQELRSEMEDGRWDPHLGSVLYVDGRLEPGDYCAATVRALDMLEPFGEGNRRPVWLARGAYPLNWRTVGKDGSHLSCSFRIGSGTYRAIGFGMADSQSLFGGRVDLAFTLSLDTWRNDGSIQLVLKGIRKHAGGRG